MNLFYIEKIKKLKLHYNYNTAILKTKQQEGIQVPKLIIYAVKFVQFIQSVNYFLSLIFTNKNALICIPANKHATCKTFHPFY